MSASPTQGSNLSWSDIGAGAQVGRHRSLPRQTPTPQGVIWPLSHLFGQCLSCAQVPGDILWVGSSPLPRLPGHVLIFIFCSKIHF